MLQNLAFPIEMRLICINILAGAKMNRPGSDLHGNKHVVCDSDLKANV